MQFGAHRGSWHSFLSTLHELGEKGKLFKRKTTFVIICCCRIVRKHENDERYFKYLYFFQPLLLKVKCYLLFIMLYLLVNNLIKCFLLLLNRRKIVNRCVNQEFGVICDHLSIAQAEINNHGNIQYKHHHLKKQKSTITIFLTKIK